MKNWRESSQNWKDLSTNLPSFYISEYLTWFTICNLYNKTHFLILIQWKDVKSTYENLYTKRSFSHTDGKKDYFHIKLCSGQVIHVEAAVWRKIGVQHGKLPSKTE